MGKTPLSVVVLFGSLGQPLYCTCHHPSYGLLQVGMNFRNHQILGFSSSDNGMFWGFRGSAVSIQTAAPQQGPAVQEALWVQAQWMFSLPLGWVEGSWYVLVIQPGHPCSRKLRGLQGSVPSQETLGTAQIRPVNSSRASRTASTTTSGKSLKMKII